MKSRALSLVLTLCILLSLMPTWALAEETSDQPGLGEVQIVDENLPEQEGLLDMSPDAVMVEEDMQDLLSDAEVTTDVIPTDDNTLLPDYQTEQTEDWSDIPELDGAATQEGFDQPTIDEAEYAELNEVPYSEDDYPTSEETLETVVNLPEQLAGEQNALDTTTAETSEELTGNTENPVAAEPEQEEESTTFPAGLAVEEFTGSENTTAEPEEPTSVPEAEVTLIDETEEQIVTIEDVVEIQEEEPASEKPENPENTTKTEETQGIQKELEVTEKTADAEKADAAQTSTDWSLETLDGTTITQDTYKKKTQLLVFYRGGMSDGEGICWNSNNLISKLADAWWTANNDVQVIAIESTDCSKAETKAYKKQYAPKAKNIVFAYGGSNLLWEKIVPETSLASSGYVTFGICVVVQKGEIVDCWQYENSAANCETKLRQFVDLGTDPRLKQTRVDGRFNQTEARKMLSMINEFRTTKKIWYWNSDDSTKTILNSNSSNQVGKLSYDYDLEQIAMKRAQELAVVYSHARPNGEMCYTLSVNGTTTCGENIAYCTSGVWDAAGVFTAWREDNENYEGQGHRRNMLNGEYVAVGFGCFEANGFTYWTQEFGWSKSGAAKTEANNSSAAALIDFDPSFVEAPTYTLDSLDQAVISKISYGSKGVTIQWNEVLGATSYQISKRVKGGSWKSLGVVTDLSFQDPDVESGKTYQYRVRAKRSDLTGAYSKTKSITYIGAPTLSSAKPAKTGVTLKWKKVAGASQYQIWRRVKTSGGWGSWKKLAKVTGTSFTDKAVKSGKTYQYRMKSVNSSGKLVNAYSNVKKITFIAAPVLAKPTVANKAVTLSWEKVPGAVKYRVFRKGPNDNGWVALKDLTKLQFVDQTVQKGVKYSYAVRCITKDGAKYTSVLSSARTVTAK